MSAFFVTGAGTEIGKTYAACALLRAWSARHVACGAFKPVVSGFDEADFAGSDPALLLGALDKAATPESIAEMAPCRFRAPLAPPLAAAMEARALRLGEIASLCRARMAEAKGFLLIEGAGGVMSPLAENATVLDLIEALDMPVLFVAGTYLGAVSHALTGLEVLARRGIAVAAIVVSESESSVGLAETCAMIGAHAQEGMIVAAPRGDAQWAEALARALEAPHA
jgi:dethiobiotin synthetase